MKLTSRITTLPGWIYNLEVEDDYEVDSVLTEGINTLSHPAVRYMEAHHLATAGLIIANCQMSFTEDTEDIFRVEGSNIMLNFGLGGSIAFEVDHLAPLRPATLSTHAISYTPYFDGRYLMPASQQIHYVCIILSESFYFHLISKESALHRDFVEHVLKKEHTYFAPKPLAVTSTIRRVLAEIMAANRNGRLPRLLLETKIKELLVIQLEYFLAGENDQIKPTHSPLQSSDIAKLTEAKRILDEQFTKPPLIAELARMVTLNEYKLKTGFKFHYNQTLYQYVIQKRMKFALSLLKDGNDSVSEVAYKVGYGDVAHFSNAFLKYYGHRPTAIAYRPGQS